MRDFLFYIMEVEKEKLIETLYNISRKKLYLKKEIIKLDKHLKRKISEYNLKYKK